MLSLHLKSHQRLEGFGRHRREAQAVGEKVQQLRVRLLHLGDDLLDGERLEIDRRADGDDEKIRVDAMVYKLESGLSTGARTVDSSEQWAWQARGKDQSM